MINKFDGMIYKSITQYAGNFGWMLVVQSLGGLVQGISIELGLIFLRVGMKSDFGPELPAQNYENMNKK